MKVLFLFGIVDSYGERHHAMSFARTLIGDGIECFFSGPTSLTDYFRPLGFRYVELETLTDLESVLITMNPDLLVCCEYWNLAGPVREIVDSFEGKVASIDGTSMGSEINNRKSDESNRFLHIFRPCPVNDPVVDVPGVYCWNLFDKRPQSVDTLSRKSKYALLAIAPWAYDCAVKHQMSGHYAKFISTLISAIKLTNLCQELVVIGPWPEKEEVVDGVTLRYCSYMMGDEYDRFLKGATMLFTDNIIQNSLIRCLENEIPAAVLINSNPALGPVYDIFPINMNVTRRSNRYLELLQVAQIDDMNEIRQAINDARNNVNSIGLSKYRHDLEQLLSPTQIVTEITQTT